MVILMLAKPWIAMKWVGTQCNHSRHQSEALRFDVGYASTNSALPDTATNNFPTMIDSHHVSTSALSRIADCTAHKEKRG